MCGHSESTNWAFRTSKFHPAPSGGTLTRFRCGSSDTHKKEDGPNASDWKKDDHPHQGGTMSVYRRQPGGPYYADVRWQGYPRIQVSTGTTNKARAKAMVGTLKRLRDVGRKDVVSLVASGRVRLADV